MSRSIPGQLMNPPSGRTLDASDVLCRDQRGQDIANAAHQIPADSTIVIVFNKAHQAAMPDAADPQCGQCSV
jgi:hypothetical protein